MPEHHAPGVYVEETPREGPIHGLSTDVVGFFGATERGPVRRPVRIDGHAQFERVFGGPLAADASGRGMHLARAVEGFHRNGGRRCWVVRVTSPTGTSSDISLSDLVGTPGAELDRARGLAALEAIPEISLLACPDEHLFPEGDVARAMVEQCERLRYRFAILSAPEAPPATGDHRPPVTSRHAAYYDPWLVVEDSRRGGEVSVPPCGHVAGIYARTDRGRGVHKAPANEVVRGIRRLRRAITEAEQAILAPRGVDVLRSFPGRGNLVRGARTTSDDPEWRYVSVRRLLLHLEHSIDEGTRWVVFEPNGPGLWTKTRQAVESFLFDQWRNGMLIGSTPDEAYFVRCDPATMTQDDIDHGRLILEVGVAPVRPAEFVVFRIGQRTGD